MKVPEMTALAATLVGSDPFVDAHAASHGGAKKLCVECLRPVWLAPSSQQLLAERPLLPVLCAECLRRLYDGRYVGVLTPESAAELASLNRDAATQN